MRVSGLESRELGRGGEGIQLKKSGGLRFLVIDLFILLQENNNQIMIS